MEIFYAIIGVIAALAAAALLVAYICYRMIFLKKAPKAEEEYPVPKGEIYEPFRDRMVEWIKLADALPRREFSITSFDGLKLSAKYYEYERGAPIEILMHGYRGNSRRDLSGGVYRCMELGHSVLIADHRASGASEGRVISFGANERRDLLSWIDFVLKNIDPEAKIIIGGISMGAATVMSAAGYELPENVVGVIADCGYTSTEDIIRKVIRDMRLPDGLLFPFVRLGARIFGGFTVDECSPIDSMSRCTLPVIFFHGDTDDFVPMEMSKKNYDACASEQKRLVIVNGAGHGLALPKDEAGYLRNLREFFPTLCKTEDEE